MSNPIQKIGSIYALYTLKGSMIYVGKTELTLSDRFDKHKDIRHNECTSVQLFQFNDVQIMCLEKNVDIIDLSNTEMDYFWCAKEKYGWSCVNVKTSIMTRERIARVINITLSSIAPIDKKYWEKLFKQENESKISCVHCNKKFANNSGLSRHKQICKKKPVVYQITEKEKKDMQAVIDKNIQLEYKVLELTQKNQLLETAEKNRLHAKQNLINLNGRQLCQFCNNTFASMNSLANHIKLCGKKSEMDKQILELNKKVETLTKGD